MKWTEIPINSALSLGLLCLLLAGPVFPQAPAATDLRPELSQEDRAFVEVHFLAAKRAEAAQEFGKAAGEYKTILAKVPTAVPRVHTNLGIALYFDRQCEAAIASLRQADKLEPGIAGNHLFLGMSYMCLAQPRQALPEFLAADKLQPTPETAAQLGMAYSLLHQPRSATKYFRVALEKGDDKETALYLLGEEYFRLAKGVAEDLVAKNPDTVYDNLVIARIFDSQQFYHVAAQAYLRAINKDPWNAATSLRLARALSLLGRKAASDKLVERYRQLVPSERERQFDETVLPQAAAATGIATTDFEQDIQSLPPVDPSRLPPLPLLQNDVNEALKQRLAADQTGRWKLAVRHFADHQPKDFITVLKSIPAAANDWLASYLIATAYVWSDDLESAETVLNSPALATRSGPAVQMLRWEVFELLGRTYYQRLLDQYPNSSRAHFVRARILDAQDKPEAVNEYKAAITANPAELGIRLVLADFYLANARIPEALTVCHQELDLNPHSADAKACLGRIYVELRQPDQGLPFLQAASKTLTGDAMIYSTIGRAYELKDDTDKAAAAYKKSLELDPSQNKLHYFLANLYRRAGRDELADKEDALFQRAGMAQREEHVNFVQRYYKGGGKGGGPPQTTGR